MPMGVTRCIVYSWGPKGAWLHAELRLQITDC